MIWLVKTREKTITDGKKGKYTYLKDCMEPADKYIKKIKPTKITPEIKQHVNYHLYQLMELYVNCKIVSKWLSLKNNQEKIDFFQNFKDINYLEEICNFYDTCCSLYEYENFTDSMKKTINFLFKENLLDFMKSFTVCVSEIENQKYEDGLTKVDAINSMLSFYLNQGIWTSLRIVPTRLCTFEKIYFQGVEHWNFDYISSPIDLFNNKFELEPISNNLEFYENSAKECFIYFLMLANKVYGSELEIKIEKIELDIKNLKENIQLQEYKIKSLEQVLDKVANKEENRKILYYQSLSREELIKSFYDFYKVQDNFLEILQTEKFEDKIILNKDFYIANGFQTLIITYLDGCVINRKNMALLRVLFHLEAKNPSSAKKTYKEKLDNFRKFIKAYDKK